MSFDIQTRLQGDSTVRRSQAPDLGWSPKIFNFSNYSQDLTQVGGGPRERSLVLQGGAAGVPFSVGELGRTSVASKKLWGRLGTFGK